MINREMLMDLTRVKAEFEKLRRGSAPSHDHQPSLDAYDAPINISVATPGPGSQTASVNDGRYTPVSGNAPCEETNMLSSVSRHFDSLAADSVLKTSSLNKP